MDSPLKDGESALLESVHFIHQLKSNPSCVAESGRPVGYIRSKVQNRSIILRTLIDSGNLFADLISEKLAKVLKLPILGQSKEVGTASAKGKVMVLGRTKPFQIYLEGIKDSVRVHPYVVRDLAHPINLGQSFLRNHSADMSFRGKGIQLRLGGSVSGLQPYNAPLGRASIDSRIKAVLDKLKDQGGNPMISGEDILDLRVNTVNQIPGVNYATNKRPIEWSRTRARVYNRDKVLLKAGHMTAIPVQKGRADQQTQFQGKQDNDVVLTPKYNNTFLNRKEIFVHPGVYSRKGDTINVMVTNFGIQDVVLPRSCNLGHVSEATGFMDHINVVDHRPMGLLSEAEVVERRNFIIESLRLDDNPRLNADPESKEAIIQIFMDNFDAISVSGNDYGKTNLMKFHINIPKDAKPVRASVRPVNPIADVDLRRQLKEWTDAGVIEPAMSPWSSALVPCVKKGTSQLRWAVDYRKINQLTVKDAFPLTSIEGNLHQLGGACVFSCLDSAGAFHSIPIVEECRDFTAFVSPHGQFRFVRVPFGLSNAPAAYSRLVQMALDRLPRGFCLGYIDDIIVYSQNLVEHISHLRQVVELHTQCGMKLNLKKCNIAQDEVEYLGHLVSATGVRMIPSYVQKVLDWPLPTTGKELRSFLGFTGYYRVFIREYSDLTYEMNKLKNDQDIVWTEDVKAKFEKLKQAFKEGPVRGYPQYSTDQPFILDTDFSSTNLAAVLSQQQDGKEVFLGCVAKKCNKAESSYPSHKGELAAVILGCKKFEHILRAKPFVIRTDSRCVKYLHSMKEYRGIYARWQAYLASFNYELIHRAGKLQRNADALSRMPGLEESVDVDILDPDDPLGDVDDIYAVQEEIGIADLRKEVANDHTLKQLLPYVKTGRKPNKEERKVLGSAGMSYVNVFELLQEEDGVLYYQAPELNGEQSRRRICLPLALLDTAFQLCHSHHMSGHQGMNRTFQQMRERFYFPQMYAYISARVNTCVNCVTKRSTMAKAGHKLHREQLSYFSQRLYVDCVGPLTGSMFQGKMCRHFVTIQDGFTGYLVAVPVETIDAATIAEAIVTRWIYVFGCPEVIHTDRGSAFTSKLFQEVMTRLGIVRTVTPAYSPESDRVERAHRVLGDVLRSDRRFGAREWPDKLLAAVMAYNTAENRVTGVSPYWAVFGTAPILPADIIFPLQRKEMMSFSTYIENLKLRFQRIYEQICKNQNASLMIDNAKYQARSPVMFKPGDSVYYFLGRVKRGLSRKLQSRWIGPWTVRRVVSESLVVIYPVGTWSANPKEVSAIVSRLRKVDPQISMADLHPSRRKQIDLEVVLDDLDEMNEVLRYQDDFEEVEAEERPVYQGVLPPMGPSRFQDPPANQEPEGGHDEPPESPPGGGDEEGDHLDEEVEEEGGQEVPEASGDDAQPSTAPWSPSSLSRIKQEVIPGREMEPRSNTSSTRGTVGTRAQPSRSSSRASLQEATQKIIDIGNSYRRKRK